MAKSERRITKERHQQVTNMGVCPGCVPTARPRCPYHHIDLVAEYTGDRRPYAAGKTIR